MCMILSKLVGVVVHMCMILSKLVGVVVHVFE